MRDPQTASLTIEHHYRSLGCDHIAGIDEAGRGAWAGPVVAAAVILPLERADLREALAGVRDSKKVTTMRQRNRLAESVRSTALAWGVGEADVDEISAYNIAGATRLAMHRALDAMWGAFPITPDLLLLDYMRLPACLIEQVSLARMDTLSLTVAAASLLAKTHRDDIMLRLDERYPGYDFAHNKGYGQPKHREGLDLLGVSPVHRLSFKPRQRRLL